MLDRAQVHGVHRQAIEGVGRQGDTIAAPQALCDLLDKKRLRLVRMNAKHFCDQRCKSPNSDSIVSA
jgi:hypothetical protein